jgi:hypothetical protein
MPDSTQDIILDELRALRGDFNTFARDTGERVSALEGSMKSVIGNGRAGRLDTLETKVDSLSAWRWRMTGISLGISGVGSALGWFVAHIMK